MCVCACVCVCVRACVLNVAFYPFISHCSYRALLEAQKIFGLDFDMEEFAQFGEDKTEYLDDEEEQEEVRM